ncbi:DUF3053 family protein [Massilia antarctica]|uniref:DUF3053 family protein n=1 Tax=Massilia antarctica TaxID=2765360 RepID=A0AA48WB95_9BURK|nr:DUF3053 family protein [Massilia antarctica]QPI49391.1 DUF3053 family protein [Massilia antarctica]
MQTVVSFSQRALMWALGGVLALGIAGCSSEPKERAAFIAFLQARIVDKPGLHVPILTRQEEKSFGDYAKHFAVITDYNKSMDAKVQQPLRDMMSKNMVITMSELVARRADVVALHKTSAQLRALIDTEQAAASTRRVALKQPDDLKPVFDKAYARAVTDPGNNFKEFLVVMEGMLTNAENMADFLDTHKDQVKFSGVMAQIDDPKVLDEATVRMKELNAKSAEVAQADRKLLSMISGH